MGGEVVVVRRFAISILLVLTSGAPLPTPAAAPPCDAPFAASAGTVATHVCDSEALGGETTVSYYRPATCSPSRRCPVLYLLHGLGGDYRDMLGTADRPSAFVRALAGKPGAADDLALILVAPDGRTPEGTDGAPPAGRDSFWVDWNPRLWSSPPRFGAFVADELVSLVDGSLPTIATREGRAIDGISLGGFGSFTIAFQHPDRYVNAGSISGALNILVAPAPQPVAPGPFGSGAPVEMPFVRPSGALTRAPAGFPFGDPFAAFGDPVADEMHYRGNNPLDLALNAEGLNLRFFHNDTVSRDPQRDLASAGGFLGAFAFESAILTMNLEMVEALTQHGHPFEHEIHPGLHSNPYWDPYIRGHLEWHWARLSRPGAPRPASTPASFDYRSTDRAFTVWGWRVEVENRTAEQFLTLWNASADGVTVVGSGTVTIRTPPLDICGVDLFSTRPRVTEMTVAGGRATVTFDLGPTSSPTDEHAGQTGLPGVEQTADLRFTRC